VSHRASGLPVQSGDRRGGGPLVVKLCCAGVQRDFPWADAVADGVLSGRGESWRRRRAALGTNRWRCKFEGS
jgi:hypothetical protein